MYAATYAVLVVLLSLLILAVPVLIGWMLDARSSGSLAAPLAIVADSWLLGHGASVVSDGVPLSITPWLLAILPFALSVPVARRVLDLAPEPAGDSPTGLARPYLEVSLAFVGGYLLMGLVVRLVAGLGPARPSWPQSLLGCVALPLLACVVAVFKDRRAGRLEDLDPLSLLVERAVPAALRRALRPAGVAVLALVGAGMLMVLVLLAVHGSRVAHLYSLLSPGVAGAVVLSLGQLAALPNLGMWAASWMSGAGVGIDGGSLTWTNADPSVLPLIPVFGAVPAPSAMPPAMWLFAVVPVLAGCFCGRSVVARMTRLSSWTAKVSTALVAAALAGVGLGVAAWASGGALGTHRLAHLGPPALASGLFLAGEIAVGAVLYVTAAHFHGSRHAQFVR